MSIEEELAKASPGSDTLYSIGVFDGVHLGHQRLLSRLKREAQKRGYLSGVVTFPRHPRLVIHPGASLTYISSFRERVTLIKSLGIDLVISLRFTHSMARLSARDFVDLLVRRLRMRGLVVGPNFALGRDKQGTPPVLEALGKEMGFEVIVVKGEEIGDQMVSSTAIREAVFAGDVALAGKMLGRPFSIVGSVVHGSARGRTLGFPTANIAVDRELAMPANGVYVSRVYLNGSAYDSVTNIGRRPTFDNGERSIEVFLLNFHDNLYGSEVRLEIIARLRGERRFRDEEELKAQITRDVARARALLHKEPQETLANAS
ncbi:MAG: bifunctional riboflavin kinase/FAD synthetase [Chloroflexi bacterium]|nr:bifunctional riboflavin kinase/FAD synthetase [Chloroflexota bacterium]